MDTRDSLTGLLTDFEANEMLRKETARARRVHTALSCAMIDIKQVSQVNEKISREAGDAVIRHVAHTLLRVIRDEDHVFRVGGDEFLVIFVMTSIEGATTAMSRFRNHLAKTILESTGYDIQVSTSIGIVGFDGRITHDELRKQAESALRAA